MDEQLKEFLKTSIASGFSEGWTDEDNIEVDYRGDEISIKINDDKYILTCHKE